METPYNILETVYNTTRNFCSNLMCFKYFVNMKDHFILIIFLLFYVKNEIYKILINDQREVKLEFSSSRFLDLAAYGFVWPKCSV